MLTGLHWVWTLWSFCSLPLSCLEALTRSPKSPLRCWSFTARRPSHRLLPRPGHVERCPRAVEPLLEFEGAGHNDIELYAQYLERLKQFISHELPNSWRRQLGLTSLTVNTSPPFTPAFTGQPSWRDHHKEARSFSGILSREPRTSQSFVSTGSTDSHILINRTVVTSSFIALQGGNESWVQNHFLVL